MIAATLLGRSLTSWFRRLRELQVSQQLRRGCDTDFPARSFLLSALVVLPRLFPEFWCDALRAAERSLIPDPVSPRHYSEPRPPPNQAIAANGAFRVVSGRSKRRTIGKSRTRKVRDHEAQ